MRDVVVIGLLATAAVASGQSKISYSSGLILNCSLGSQGALGPDDASAVVATIKVASRACDGRHVIQAITKNFDASSAPGLQRYGILSRNEDGSHVAACSLVDRCDTIETIPRAESNGQHLAPLVSQGSRSTAGGKGHDYLTVMRSPSGHESWIALTKGANMGSAAGLPDPPEATEPCNGSSQTINTLPDFKLAVRFAAQDHRSGIDKLEDRIIPRTEVIQHSGTSGAVRRALDASTCSTRLRTMPLPFFEGAIWASVLIASLDSQAGLFLLHVNATGMQSNATQDIEYLASGPVAIPLGVWQSKGTRLAHSAAIISEVVDPSVTTPIISVLLAVGAPAGDLGGCSESSEEAAVVTIQLDQAGMEAQLEVVKVTQLGAASAFAAKGLQAGSAFNSLFGWALVASSSSQRGNEDSIPTSAQLVVSAPQARWRETSKATGAVFILHFSRTPLRGTKVWYLTAVSVAGPSRRSTSRFGLSLGPVEGRDDFAISAAEAPVIDYQQYQGAVSTARVIGQELASRLSVWLAPWGTARLTAHSNVTSLPTGMNSHCLQLVDASQRDSNSSASFELSYFSHSDCVVRSSQSEVLEVSFSTAIPAGSSIGQTFSEVHAASECIGPSFYLVSFGSGWNASGSVEMCMHAHVNGSTVGTETSWVQDRSSSVDAAVLASVRAHPGVAAAFDPSCPVASGLPATAASPSPSATASMTTSPTSSISPSSSPSTTSSISSSPSASTTSSQSPTPSTSASPTLSPTPSVSSVPIAARSPEAYAASRLNVSTAEQTMDTDVTIAGVSSPSRYSYYLGHNADILGDVDGNGVADWVTTSGSTAKVVLHDDNLDVMAIQSIPLQVASYGVIPLGDVDGNGAPDFAAGPSAWNGRYGQIVLLNRDGTSKQVLSASTINGEGSLKCGLGMPFTAFHGLSGHRSVFPLLKTTLLACFPWQSVTGPFGSTRGVVRSMPIQRDGRPANSSYRQLNINYLNGTVSSIGPIPHAWGVTPFLATDPRMTITEGFGLSITRLNDVDKNGAIDFAVSARGGSGLVSSPRVAVVLQSRYGPFDNPVNAHDVTPPEIAQSQSTLSAVASPGDLDGSGTFDLVIGNRNFDDGSIFIVLLNKNGSRNCSSQIVSGTSPGFSTIGAVVQPMGDVDGNGIGDIYTVGSSATSMSVILLLGHRGVLLNAIKLKQHCGWSPILLVAPINASTGILPTTPKVRLICPLPVVKTHTQLFALPARVGIPVLPVLNTSVVSADERMDALRTKLSQPAFRMVGDSATGEGARFVDGVASGWEAQVQLPALEANRLGFLSTLGSNDTNVTQSSKRMLRGSSHDRYLAGRKPRELLNYIPYEHYWKKEDEIFAQGQLVQIWSVFPSKQCNTSNEVQVECCRWTRVVLVNASQRLHSRDGTEDDTGSSRNASVIAVWKLPAGSSRVRLSLICPVALLNRHSTLLQVAPLPLKSMLAYSDSYASIDVVKTSLGSLAELHLGTSYSGNTSLPTSDSELQENKPPGLLLDILLVGTDPQAVQSVVGVAKRIASPNQGTQPAYVVSQAWRHLGPNHTLISRSPNQDRSMLLISHQCGPVRLRPIADLDDDGNLDVAVLLPTNCACSIGEMGHEFVRGSSGILLLSGIASPSSVPEVAQIASIPFNTSDESPIPVFSTVAVSDSGPTSCTEYPHSDSMLRLLDVASVGDFSHDGGEDFVASQVYADWSSPNPAPQSGVWTLRHAIDVVPKPNNTMQRRRLSLSGAVIVRKVITEEDVAATCGNLCEFAPSTGSLVGAALAVLKPGSGATVAAASPGVCRFRHGNMVSNRCGAVLLFTVQRDGSVLGLQLLRGSGSQPWVGPFSGPVTVAEMINDASHPAAKMHISLGTNFEYVISYGRTSAAISGEILHGGSAHELLIEAAASKSRNASVNVSNHPGSLVLKRLYSENEATSSIANTGFVAFIAEFLAGSHARITLGLDGSSTNGDIFAWIPRGFSENQPAAQIGLPVILQKSPRGLELIVHVPKGAGLVPVQVCTVAGVCFDGEAYFAEPILRGLLPRVLDQQPTQALTLLGENLDNSLDTIAVEIQGTGPCPLFRGETREGLQSLECMPPPGVGADLQVFVRTNSRVQLLRRMQAIDPDSGPAIETSVAYATPVVFAVVPASLQEGSSSSIDLHQPFEIRGNRFGQVKEQIKTLLIGGIPCEAHMLILVDEYTIRCEQLSLPVFNDEASKQPVHLVLAPVNSSEEGNVLDSVAESTVIVQVRHRPQHQVALFEATRAASTGEYDQVHLSWMIQPEHADGVRLYQILRAVPRADASCPVLGEEEDDTSSSSPWEQVTIVDGTQGARLSGSGVQQQLSFSANQIVAGGWSSSISLTGVELDGTQNVFRRKPGLADINLSFNYSALVGKMATSLSFHLCNSGSCPAYLRFEAKISTAARSPECFALRPLGDQRLQAVSTSSEAQCGLSCSRLPGPAIALQRSVSEACFSHEYLSANHSCFECPIGAVCCGSEQDLIAPQPRYWPIKWQQQSPVTISSAGPMFARCHSPEACIGIDPMNTADQSGFSDEISCKMQLVQFKQSAQRLGLSTQSRRMQSNLTQLESYLDDIHCAEGYQGTLCSSCAAGYHDPFSSGSCRQCQLEPRQAKQAFAAITAAAVILLCAASVYLYLGRDPQSSARDMAIVKILFDHTQSLAVMHQLTLVWSRASDDLAEGLDYTLLDPRSLWSWSCMHGKPDVVQESGLFLLAPVVLLFAIAVTWTVYASCEREEVLEKEGAVFSPPAFCGRLTWIMCCGTASGRECCKASGCRDRGEVVRDGWIASCCFCAKFPGDSATDLQVLRRDLHSCDTEAEQPQRTLRAEQVLEGVMTTLSFSDKLNPLRLQNGSIKSRQSDDRKSALHSSHSSCRRRQSIHRTAFPGTKVRNGRHPAMQVHSFESATIGLPSLASSPTMASDTLAGLHVRRHTNGPVSSDEDVEEGALISTTCGPSMEVQTVGPMQPAGSNIIAAPATVAELKQRRPSFGTLRRQSLMLARDATGRRQRRRSFSSQQPISLLQSQQRVVRRRKSSTRLLELSALRRGTNHLDRFRRRIGQSIVFLAGILYMPVVHVSLRLLATETVCPEVEPGSDAHETLRGSVLGYCREFLAADLSLPVESQQMREAVAIGATGLFVWGCCTIVGIVGMLTWIRDDLEDENVRALFGSLYTSYRPVAWYWEGVFMSRKLVLAVIVSVLASYGAAVQLVLLMCVVFAVVVHLVAVRPWRYFHLNALAITGWVAQFLTLAGGLMPAVLASTDDGIQLYPVSGSAHGIRTVTGKTSKTIQGLAFVLQVVPNVVFLVAVATFAAQAVYARCRSNRMISQLQASIAARIGRGTDPTPAPPHEGRKLNSSPGVPKDL